jgi:hypothetical protein
LSRWPARSWSSSPNLLRDPAARFHDLGAKYHATRINTERRTRSYLAQLAAMGYRVTLEPTA